MHSMPALAAWRSGEAGEMRLRALELALGARPLVEELGHVGGQVLDHRQVGQRRDLELTGSFDHLGHVRAAGPARLAVDRHRAGTAHAHAAREAVAERGFQVALDVGDDVEHRLAALAGHVVGTEAALRLAAPDLHLENFAHAL